MTLPTMDGGLMVIALGFQQMQKEGFFVFLNEEQERVIFVIFSLFFDQLREDSRVF